MVLVETQEVVGLQQHVTELGVGDALLRPLEAGPDRILGHHLIDREVLPDVAQELDGRDGAQPGAVVEEEGVGEVEELAQLGSDAVEVGVEHLPGQHGAFVGPATRVPDQPGGPSGQGDGPMAGQLEAAQGAELEQAADVQAVGGRVEADVDGEAPRVESRRKRGVGHLMDQAAKDEVLRERGHDPTLPYPGNVGAP